MSFIFIYVTNPDLKKAKKIAQHLLKKRLVGCINLFPIESMYWWKGKIANEKEVVMIAKTLESKFEEVKKEIEKIHPYTTPCIVKIPVSSNKEFFEWLKGEVE